MDKKWLFMLIAAIGIVLSVAFPFTAYTENSIQLRWYIPVFLMGMLLAVLLSALLFGIMHFNIVQFIYAFVLGVLLALFMEKCGHFFAAVLGHVTVNLISVVRTQTGILQHTVDGSAFAWVFSVAVFAAGAVLLYIGFVRKLQTKE